MKFWQKDMRSCYKYGIENVSNYFLIKAGMCYWKDKIIKCEINSKTCGNCVWIKRIKTGENYAEAIIAMSENVSTLSTAKLPNCQ